MVFHRSLSDHKSPQVSRTFHSILADLNNAVVWLVSTRPVISKSFILYEGTKNIKYILYYRHFHVPQLFQFFSKVEVLILLFTSF